MGATQVNFWDTTIGKTLRAALYLAASAVISYVITQTSGNPQLFGTVTPIVNVVLVGVKNLLDKNTPNTTNS